MNIPTKKPDKLYYEPGAEGLTDHDERDAVIAALQAALESFGKSMQVLKKERDEARDQAEYYRERYEQLKDAREPTK